MKSRNKKAGNICLSLFYEAMLVWQVKNKVHPIKPARVFLLLKPAFPFSYEQPGFRTTSNIKG
jgi:hypothetical protein